jgi:hypothetical protein
LAYPQEYQSPSNAFSVYTIFVVAAHFAVSCYVLFQAFQQGKKVFAIFLVFLMLAPATVADITVSMASPCRPFRR